MAQQTTKERRVALTKALREAAAKEEPLARMAIEMVKLSGDEAKESLVSAEGEDIHRLQGAARHMIALYRDLTRDPMNVTPGA